MEITTRQKDVLNDVLDGLSIEQIARKQYIEITTVKSHLIALYRMFNVNSRAMLIAKIYKEKINKIKEIVGG